jgi:hypothetical protein
MTTRAMDHLTYAEQVAIHAGEGWAPAPGYEDRGLDQGNLRIFQEDLGARAVELFIFDEQPRARGLRELQQPSALGRRRRDRPDPLERRPMTATDTSTHTLRLYVNAPDEPTARLEALLRATREGWDPDSFTDIRTVRMRSGSGFHWIQLRAARRERTD